MKEPLLWVNFLKPTVTYEKPEPQTELKQYQPWAYNMKTSYYNKIYAQK